VKYYKDVLELFLDERVKVPIIRIRGEKAEKMFEILSKKFILRENGNAYEVVVPLIALPAVETWILACYTATPSEESLNMLLESTPKTITDLISDLITISSKHRKAGNKPLINHSIAQKASKIIRELLEIYT
jgi:hypothetical protein